MVCLKPLYYRESRIEVRKSSVIYMLTNINNCWFTRDVTVVCWWSRTKSISLLWELNSIFMYILRKKICCIDQQHNTNMAALSRGCKPRIRLGKTRMWKELECLWESRFKSRLQNSSYFCVFNYTVRTNSLKKSWKRRAKLERDARFFPPAPHTRRACEARALSAREALTLLFCPINQF